MRLSKWMHSANNRWKITDRLFLSLAVTGAVIEFSHVGASFIDGLITSNFLGSNEMAAIGIAIPVFSILGLISGLIAMGMQIRGTAELGRGNVRGMNRYFSVSMLAGVIVSLIAALVLIPFARPFVVLLGARGNAAELADLSADYVRGIGIGAPALIMSAILSPAIQLDSGRKTILTGAAITAVSDIVLDLVAVKLNTGVFGIAIATALSNYLNLLYQCTHFLKKNRMLHFVKPDVPLSEFFRMLIGGSEKAMRRAVNIIRPIVLNLIIIAYGGTQAMSALSIQNNFRDFTEIFLSGIAEAVLLLTSLYFSEMNGEALEEVGRCAHRTIAFSSGIIFILLMVFARPLAGLYIAEEGELKEMVVFTIRMLALENPMYALINSRIKYLQAVRRKLNMNLLLFSARLVLSIPTAYMMARLFRVYGILASFMVTNLLSLVAVYTYYQISCKTKKPAKNDFLALPPEFEPNPEDVISLHVRTREDMAITAEQIGLFCKGHKFSPRICYYTSLVFEELTNNIITHGFPLNKTKEPIVDVRLVAKGRRLILRLKDNCPQFDITRKIAEINAEGADPLHNIGTRITSRIAADIRYASTFETNNIIIEYHDEEKESSDASVSAP